MTAEQPALSGVPLDDLGAQAAACRARGDSADDCFDVLFDAVVQASPDLARNVRAKFDVDDELDLSGMSPERALFVTIMCGSLEPIWFQSNWKASSSWAMPKMIAVPCMRSTSNTC